MPGQYGPPIYGSNPYGRPDVINSIREPQNPQAAPQPPMPGMPPMKQRPISSIWMKYPAGQQGPGQQPALAAQQNPFAAARSDYDSSFQFLMNSLGKYMGGNR